MKDLMYEINKWFEINIGWFFINGRKTDWYNNYLMKRYYEKQK